MRFHRIMGLLAAVACIVAAITMRSPLMIFFDLTSLFVFVVGTLGLLAITYGRGALELRSAFRAWLLGATTIMLPCLKISTTILTSPERPRSTTYCVTKLDTGQWRRGGTTWTSRLEAPA